jgi:glycosyltransferase involved in cell wall biosynthesis
LKVLQLYNDYRSSFGGEKIVVDATIRLLQEKGIETILISRTSKNMRFTDKVRAFGSGIYSFFAYRELSQTLETEKPDIVHAHNLYPFLSPSVLVACRHHRVPVVMSVHNFGLTCPHWHHLYKGKQCTKCLGGREYWCIIKNCQDNIFESLGYSIRNMAARKLRYFHENVTLMIALSNFAREWFTTAGYEKSKLVVLPNMVSSKYDRTDSSKGLYVAFAGRISAEKGIGTLLSAAARLPDVPIALAGEGPMMDEFSMCTPTNVTFCGRLEGEQLLQFYRKARFLVFPSKCSEMCPLVISEAMSHGLPVIATRIGGLPELVESGVTGLLFEPGNADDLAMKIKRLWDNPQLCRDMGQAGRSKASREYSEQVYFQRLMDIYARAIELNKNEA